MKTLQKKKLFVLLWRPRRQQKRKKKRKKSRFVRESFFIKGSNMENIATSAGTKNLRLRILFYMYSHTFHIGWILTPHSCFSCIPISWRETISLKCFVMYYLIP